MKEIDELNIPDDLFYTDDHEWVMLKDGVITVGLDDYAQNQLGDIVFVELPGIGCSFATGDEVGTVESVKTVSEVFMPIDGVVIAVNEALENSPEFINSSPYAKGWIIKIQPDDPSDVDLLLDKYSYISILK